MCEGHGTHTTDKGVGGVVSSGEGGAGLKAVVVACCFLLVAAPSYVRDSIQLI